MSKLAIDVQLFPAEYFKSYAASFAFNSVAHFFGVLLLTRNAREGSNTEKSRGRIT